MTRRSKDAVEARFHESRGHLTEVAETSDTKPALETRSADDNAPERVQHLIGRFENFLGE